MAAATDFRSSVDIPPPQRERMGSMSLGQPPAGENGGSVANGAAPPAAVTSPTGPSNPNHIDAPKEVQDVLQSEIGVSAMLNRLKQSIASVREFAMFLKKRGQLEQDHSNHLKKLSQGTMETMSRGEHKGGTFASAYSQMMETHNRMADNGVQFGQSLQTMHEDLLELAAMAEKNRKGWKQNGLAAEQRVADLETAMRKSKAKYESLAEEYDRVRTGDTGGQRPKFGFKGHKSAAQQEEDLLRKVQAADEDYKGKVQTYQVERSELIKTARPDAVKALHDNIRECDSGLALQMQKFASFNEKLLLSNGLSISPLKGPGKPDARSLKEIASSIDNERDLNEYIGGYHNKLPPRTGEPVYERHPVLDNTRQNPPPSQAPSAVQSPTQAMGQPPMGPGPVQQPASMSSRTGPIGGFPDASQSPGGAPPMGPVPVMPAAQRQGSGQHERSFSHSSMYGQGNQGQQQSPFSTRNSAQPTVPNSRFNTSANSSQGPPQLGALSFQTSQPQQPPQLQGPPGPQGPISNPLMSHPPNQRPGSSGLGQVRAQSPPQMAPTKPVFGISLSRLYDRDALAVPMVVYQCIQAVDLYGLSVEGIYRLSGSVPHVNKLKGMFDTGDSNSANLDFRNPENFFHDVNSVAGLLKQFFRDLPDPLLTKEHYSGFIEAAKNDDDIVRRDSLHAIINSLPDPNYATLRALTLHLHRVMENSKVNRMSSQNLAIVFGPTLMGTGSGSNIADAGWQVRAVDTILQNTYQIFDDD